MDQSYNQMLNEGTFTQDQKIQLEKLHLQYLGKTGSKINNNNKISIKDQIANSIHAINQLKDSSLFYPAEPVWTEHEQKQFDEQRLNYLLQHSGYTLEQINSYIQQGHTLDSLMQWIKEHLTTAQKRNEEHLDYLFAIGYTDAQITDFRRQGYSIEQMYQFTKQFHARRNEEFEKQQHIEHRQRIEQHARQLMAQQREQYQAQRREQQQAQYQAQFQIPEQYQAQFHPDNIVEEGYSLVKEKGRKTIDKSRLGKANLELKRKKDAQAVLQEEIIQKLICDSGLGSTALNDSGKPWLFIPNTVRYAVLKDLFEFILDTGNELDILETLYREQVDVLSEKISKNSDKISNRFHQSTNFSENLIPPSYVETIYEPFCEYCENQGDRKTVEFLDFIRYYSYKNYPKKGFNIAINQVLKGNRCYPTISSTNKTLHWSYDNFYKYVYGDWVNQKNITIPAKKGITFKKMIRKMEKPDIIINRCGKLKYVEIFAEQATIPNEFRTALRELIEVLWYKYDELYLEI